MYISYLNKLFIIKFSVCQKSGGNPSAKSAHIMVFNSHLAVKCAKDALGEIVEDNPEQQLFGLTFIIDRGLQKLRYIKTNGPSTTVRLVNYY